MNWLQKLAQIPGNHLQTAFWFHGTDASTAYTLMRDMFLRPRQETGQSSYSGSLSSIPGAVYLTASVRKAIKHAKERSQTTRSHPVVLVINPTSLGLVHVDEDFVHMMLQGKTFWDNVDWHPSPVLEQEIFEQADELTRASDYYPGNSTKSSVLKYFRDASDNNIEIDEEYLKEEGIIPDESGNYEFDESMHVAKQIAATLNDKHQIEAIQNFQSLAHQGKVQANEIYLVPENIDISEEQDESYNVASEYINTYTDLKRYCQRIDPKQLLFEFLK